MNSGLAKNLLYVVVGIVIALLFVVKPWLGLVGMIGVGVFYGHRARGMWRSRFDRLSRWSELSGQVSFQEIDPVVSYQKRGEDRLNQQDYDGALADFNRVIDVDQNFVPAYYYRALALMAIEEPEDAIADLEVAANLVRHNKSEPLRAEIDRLLRVLKQAVPGESPVLSVKD